VLSWFDSFLVRAAEARLHPREIFANTQELVSHAKQPFPDAGFMAFESLIGMQAPSSFLQKIRHLTTYSRLDVAGGKAMGRRKRGEKPGDLPFQQPTKYQLTINLKTAKALGIEVPNSIQLLADEVIE
jgi:hypothetical protein